MSFDTVSYDLTSVNFRVLVSSRFVFFLMIRRPPRSTLDRSSAASDVYKRQLFLFVHALETAETGVAGDARAPGPIVIDLRGFQHLSLIHISEPTRPY